MTERRDRVDPNRPPRRNRARHQRDGGQQGDRPGKGRKIGRGNPLQRAGEGARPGKASSQADQDPDADEQHAVADDQQEDAMAVRSEREPYAHLAGPSREENDSTP